MAAEAKWRCTSFYGKKSSCRLTTEAIELLCGAFGLTENRDVSTSAYFALTSLIRDQLDSGFEVP